MPHDSSNASAHAAATPPTAEHTLRGRLIPALNPCWRLWMREEGQMQLMCLAQLGLELWSVQTDGRHFYMCHDRKVRRVAADCEEVLRRELHAVRGGFVREARLRLGEAVASSVMFGGGRPAGDANAVSREVRVRQALGGLARAPLGAPGAPASSARDAAARHATAEDPTPAPSPAGGAEAPDILALPTVPAATVQVSYRRRRHVVVTAPGAAHAA